MVTRDELFDAIWDGRAVGEVVLSTRLNAARHAIGDSGAEQRLIRTLRGKGLRFVGIVTTAHGALAGIELPDRLSLRIAPFRASSADRREAPLAVALAEEITTALSASDWIAVAPPTARGARFQLEGAVRQAGERLRIFVRLLDLSINRYIWGERYERNVAEVLQKNVADDIAARLGAAVFSCESARAGLASGAQPSVWEAIVRALALMNTRDRAHVSAARAVLEEAIAADPACSRAYSLLSFAFSLGIHMGWEPRKTGVPLALRIGLHALSLNPEDAWAHVALGYASLWRHPDDAIPRLEHALKLNPNLSIAHYLLGLASLYAGHGEHIFRHADAAEVASPFDLLARGNAGVDNNLRATASFIAGDYLGGAAYARKALHESPMLVAAYRPLVVNHAQAGNLVEAKAALAALKRLVPDISLHRLEETSSVWVRREDAARYREAYRIAGLS